MIEFACTDGSDIVLVHPVLVTGLEELRAQLNRTHARAVRIAITSGYRTLSHNKAIGGAENSRHLWGLAADIKAWIMPQAAGEGRIQVDPDEVAELANVMAWAGVGRYNTFTHVDISRASRRWDRRTTRRAA